MLLQEPISGDFLVQIFPIAIVVALSFLGLVIWMAWIVYRRQQRGQSGGRSAGGEAGELDQFVEGTSAPATDVAPHSNRAAASIRDDAVEVFRVLRDLADGSLIVEIDAQRYQRLADISDAQVGRRFVTNARALAHFAMILKGPPPPAPPPEAPAAARPRASATPAPPPAPVGPPPPTIGATSRPPSGPPQPVEMRPLKALRRQSKKDEEEAEPPAELISVADQIEELLQYRLASHPTLSRRSIHVRPAFGGGVRIVVDDTSYDGVDVVPEPDVRAFIQEIIQEWNARS